MPIDWNFCQIVGGKSQLREPWIRSRSQGPFNREPKHFQCSTNGAKSLIQNERPVGQFPSWPTCYATNAEGDLRGAHFKSADAGSMIKARCLVSWIWSQTKWSRSQAAWRSARAASWESESWLMAKRSPHSAQATTLMTTLRAAALSFVLSFLKRSRRAVPLEAGVAFTTGALWAGARVRDSHRGCRHRHVRRARRHYRPWAALH